MTLVVDASVVEEILVRSPIGVRCADWIQGQILLAPMHISVEVTSAIRKNSLAGLLEDEHAKEALNSFLDLGIQMVDMTESMVDAWELRDNFSAYDAMYVVLARHMGVKLLTLDERLVAAAPDCAVMP